MSTATQLLAADAARPGQRSWFHAIVRWLFIAVSLTFLAAVLLAPLATVFAMAFARGVEAYARAFADPDTAAAIRLTLITAAVTGARNDAEARAVARSVISSSLVKAAAQKIIGDVWARLESQLAVPEKPPA